MTTTETPVLSSNNYQDAFIALAKTQHQKLALIKDAVYLLYGVKVYYRGIYIKEGLSALVEPFKYDPRTRLYQEKNLIRIGALESFNNDLKLADNDYFVGLPSELKPTFWTSVKTFLKTLKI